jgi:hypothetical protein
MKNAPDYAKHELFKHRMPQSEKTAEHNRQQNFHGTHVKDNCEVFPDTYHHEEQGE